MLISIILTLTSPAPASLPAHLGRANYAAVLSRLAQIDPALVQRIHDGDGPKPLTCSGLLNAPPQGESVPIAPNQPYYLRVTGLTPEVSQGLQQGLLHDPPAVWELDHHPFQVVEVISDAARQPWSGTSSYETLAAAQLLRGEALPRQVTLEFASPTAFKSKEMHIPVPMPGLVFGSLVERWNTFSPVTISPELRRFGEEMVAISRYKLESRPVPSKPGAGKAGLRMGGVGRVTYAALGGDRYWLGLLHMLANFALYSGVGVQTSVGMGQVRLVEGETGRQGDKGTR